MSMSKHYEHNFRMTTGGDAICFGCGERIQSVDLLESEQYGDKLDISEPSDKTIEPPQTLSEELDQLGFTFGDDDDTGPPAPIHVVPIDDIVSNSLNDLELARVERDAAMRAVEAAAGEEWNISADVFIEAYARTHFEVFSDWIWNAGLPIPKNRKSLGPRMLYAAKIGIIAKFDPPEFRPSMLSHGSPGITWRSLIYEGTDLTRPE